MYLLKIETGSECRKINCRKSKRKKDTFELRSIFFLSFNKVISEKAKTKT